MIAAMFKKIIEAIGQFGLDHNGVAQMAHGLAGVLFVVLADYLLGVWQVGGVLLLAWAIAKEFWLDIKYEDQTISAAAMDWVFYMLGGGIGWLLMLAHKVL